MKNEPEKMKNESEIQNVRDLIEVLRKLSDEERREIFSNFCTSCGSENPSCQCWRDE